MALFQLIRVFGFLVSGSMTFTLRKFYESPVAIQGIQNLDLLFNVLVAVPCLYYSDRIWTRFGRRLPFVHVAFFFLLFAMVLIPMAESRWTVTLLIIVWYIFWDVGSAYETLIWEIIPPAQRARFGVLDTWFMKFGMMLGGLVISGRFDDIVKTANFRINGEQLIYWWGAMCIFFCMLFLLLFVREVKPKQAAPPRSGNPIIAPIKGMFLERDLWPVYMLMLSVMLMQNFSTAMQALLFTEQWGYSKQDMGTNLFLGGLILVVIVIPLIGVLGDKVSRLKLFCIGAFGGFFAELCFYLFVKLYLPDEHPSLNQIFIFGIVQSSIGLIGGVAMWPLIYEFVPRTKMGAAQGGINLVRSMTRLMLLSGVAVFVSGYSKLFMPEGEYDYFSYVLFNLFLHLIGLLFIARFVFLVVKKRITRLGIEEFQPVEEQSGDSEEERSVP